MRMSTIAFAAADKGSGAAAPKPTPTPIGQPAATAPATAPAPATASSVTKIRNDVPPPPKKSGGRGGQTLYDFNNLEIGQSFGVVGKTIKGMASTVSSANKRFNKPVKGPDGKDLVDAAGKVITAQERKFVCGTVTPTEDDPATVRVWRVALDY